MLENGQSVKKLRGWNTPFVSPDNGVVINERFWIVRLDQASPHTKSTRIRVFDIEAGTLSRVYTLKPDVLYSLKPEVPATRIGISRFGNEKTTRMHIDAPYHVKLLKEENYIGRYRDIVFGEPLPKSDKPQ